MSYPTSSSASDVWSLRDVYKAEAGGDWPSPFVSNLANNTWVLNDGLGDITRLYFGGTTYTGADVTQARLETLFNETNFQDVNASNRTLSYLYMAPNSGESITIEYNVPGTTEASFQLQRVSSVAVNFTISGSISLSGTADLGGVVFTADAPESGIFTITADNDTPGLIVWAISFNGATPGDLTYG